MQKPSNRDTEAAALSAEPQGDYRKGIFFILLSSLGFSLMSFFIRLSGDLPVMEKAFFRNALAGVVAFILLRRSGTPFKIGKGNRIPMLLRCSFGTAGLLCNFWAISRLNIADANMLNKMSPFFAILMSVFVLGEKPSRFEILSIFIAMTGAAFVVKPGAGLASLPAFIGLLGGFGAGTAYTFLRKMGRNGVAGPVIVFCFSAFSCLICLPYLIFFYHPMQTWQLIDLILAGLSAAGAQLAITQAYTCAPARVISVFDYTQVLFAALLGFFFLHELPDALSFLGYFLIIGIAALRWYLAVKKRSCQVS